MTRHDEQDQPVANPDRTTLHEHHDPKHPATPERQARDQPRPDAAEYVEEAIENADGPL